MISTILSMCIVLALFAFIWRIRTVQISNSEEMRKEFYGLAEGLISDDYTPQIIAEYIMWMAQDIRNGAAFRKFVWHLLTRKATKRLSSNINKDYEAAVQELISERREQFKRATVLFICSWTYSSMIVGTIFRRLLVLYAKNNGQSNGASSQYGNVIYSDMFINENIRAA